MILTEGEFWQRCKPGEGANTCIWAMASQEGIECAFFCRPSALVKRWLRGDTVAQRDGCEHMKAMQVAGTEVEYVQAKSLKDVLGGEDN